MPSSSELAGDFREKGFKIFLFWFASLFGEAFWIFDQDVVIELGGAPSSVELNGVTVQLLWWQAMELMLSPVLVIWTCEANLGTHRFAAH